jgi:cell division protease FtsH
MQFGSGGITTGAKNDIERATGAARKMVCEWGMSDKLGPLLYGQKEEPIFIGKEIARHKDYSEKTSEMIDEEIKEIVEHAYSKAWELLTKNKTNLSKLAKQLLDQEVLDRKAIEDIINIKKTPKTKKTRPADNDVLNGNEKKKKTGKEKMTLGKIQIATNEAGGE